MAGNKNLRPIGALKATLNGGWSGKLYPKDRDTRIQVSFVAQRKADTPGYWNVYDPNTGEQIGFLALGKKRPYVHPVTGETITPTKDIWHGVILDVAVSASVPESRDEDGNPRMVVKQRLGVPVIPFKPMVRR